MYKSAGIIVLLMFMMAMFNPFKLEVRNSLSTSTNYSPTIPDKVESDGWNYEESHLNQHNKLKQQRESIENEINN